MDKAIEYGTKALIAAIAILDAYLRREGTEKILDQARATYVAEGRPPNDAELLENVAVAQAINERIQQA